MHRTLRQIIASIQTSYDLIVIEEEKIPLVASITRDYEVWLTVTWALIIFFVMLAVLMVYGNTCNWKKQRIAELEERYGQEGYKGWNLVKLRREESRLEMEAVAAQMRL